jgi:alpha-beta hydrolase superfamily lysophospholipase
MIASFCFITFGFIASWYVAGALIAPSPAAIGDPPRELNASAFAVNSDSGSTISGWHTQPDSSNGVVVLFHGIRGSRLSMLTRARMLHDAGYSTVMIDFQAHGESPGDAIMLGHLEQHDVRATIEFARREHPNEPIGVIGVSLGGAASLLASPLDIDALVLESVYPNIRDAVHNRVAAQLGPLSWIPASLLLAQLQPRLGVSPAQLRPIDHMTDIDCPVCVASGTADRHTTESETRAMFSAAPSPKQLWLVDGAAHVDLLENNPIQYEQQVLGFLGRHLRKRRKGKVEPSNPPDSATVRFERNDLPSPAADR